MLVTIGQTRAVTLWSERSQDSVRGDDTQHQSPKWVRSSAKLSPPSLWPFCPVTPTSSTTQRNTDGPEPAEGEILHSQTFEKQRERNRVSL